MLIPRGGNSLHRLCREQSTIPVITGGIGICHYYVDITADSGTRHGRHRQRPHPASLRLQRPRYAARQPSDRARVSAQAGATHGRVRCRDTCDIRRHAISHRPRGYSHPGRAGRLGHRVDGADPRRQTGGPHSKRPSLTFKSTARTTPTVSSPRTGTTPSASSMPSTPQPSSSTPAPASTTAASLASAPRSQSAHRSSTPAGRWGWKS